MSIKCIPISKATAGMILAKPVLDESGRTLCGSGKEISEKLLSKLDTMHIDSVYIQSDEKISEEEFDHRRDEIMRRFSKIPEGSLLDHLKNLLLKRLESRKKEE